MNSSGSIYIATSGTHKAIQENIPKRCENCGASDLKLSLEGWARKIECKYCGSKQYIK